MLTIALPKDVPVAVVNEHREKTLFAPDKASRVFSAQSSAVIHLLSVLLIFSLPFIYAMQKSSTSLILLSLNSSGLSFL